MGHDHPRVSIGMPVYNGQRYIGKTIESLLRQTFQDFELIISDNASTDGTQTVCREYEAADSRIRYHRNSENLGAQANYNAVFLQARAPYFKWASSNDLCEPRFLETCVQQLDEHSDAVLAYPRTRLLLGDEGTAEDYQEPARVDQDRPCDRFRDFLENGDLNNVMNGLIRADALRRTSLMRTYLGSDMVLMAELALYGKFVQIPEVLFLRRIDPSSKVTLRSREDIIRHYDPRIQRMVFQRWKFHMGCFSAIVRTPLTTREKICLLRFLLGQLVRDRGRLAQDLRDAARA